jgi:hypothetical protein
MQLRAMFLGFVVLVSAGSLGYGLHAYAEGAPTTKPLFYAGTLESGGKLANGAHTIVLTLYDAEAAGNQVCLSETPNAPVEGGRFRVEVSADCVAKLKLQPDVWAALKFTGPDGVPHELPLRSKIGAVPFAVEAQHSVSASAAALANAAGGALAETLATLRRELTETRASVTAIVGSSAVSVTAAAIVSVPHATFVNLPFSRVEWDALSEYNAATGFTAKNTGVYNICGSVQWVPGQAVSEIDVFVDGTRFRAMGAGSAGICGGCVDVRLNAGQRAQVSAYQISGTTQNVAAEPLWSYLNIHRVY